MKKMKRLFTGSALVCAAVASSGGDAASTLPLSFVDALVLEAQTPPAAHPLAGRWAGSSLVESVSESAPACLPKWWQRRFSDQIAAEVVAIPGAKTLALHLRQQASGELCHLELAPGEDGVTARPFDDQGTGAEGVQWCHFRIDTSAWGCTGTPPNVWLLGVKLAGTFADESRSRIRGRMEVGYDHRPGGRRVPYRLAVLAKTFDLRKEGQ
jgi:hypothetical protein